MKAGKKQSEPGEDKPLPVLYKELGEAKVKSLWTFHAQQKRKTKTGGRNGGRPPRCGNCGKADCESCQRRGKVAKESRSDE